MGSKNKVEHGQQTGLDQEKEKQKQSREEGWGAESISKIVGL